MKKVPATIFFLHDQSTVCSIVYYNMKVTENSAVGNHLILSSQNYKIMLLESYTTNLENKMNWKCQNGFSALQFWTRASLTLKMHAIFNCILFYRQASSGPTLSLRMFPLALGRRWVHADITSQGDNHDSSRVYFTQKMGLGNKQQNVFHWDYQCASGIWHSGDHALWYTSILIMNAKQLHYFSNLFDKLLYIFRTGPLSIIRSISTLYTWQ
jgi:hypothetical protein